MHEIFERQLYAMDTQVEYDLGRKPWSNHDTQEPDRGDECESFIGGKTDCSRQIDFNIHLV